MRGRDTQNDQRGEPAILEKPRPSLNRPAGVLSEPAADNFRMVAFWKTRDAGECNRVKREAQRMAGVSYKVR